MADFLYPTPEELNLAAQDLLPRLEAGRVGFQYFPIISRNVAEIVWDQQDIYTGLQQIRGLEGAPRRVKHSGGKRYITEPGVYGEFTVIGETALTRAGVFGQIGAYADATELVAMDQVKLLQRRLDRIELIIWTLLTTGTFSTSTEEGAVAATDTYTFQSFSAAAAWGTFATATPLADLRSIQLLARGHSVMFDNTAVALMNRITANKLFSNTNNADIYGRRTAGLGTYNSFDQLNSLFTEDGLPAIVIYDQGYMPDGGGSFVPFIPDNKVIVIGTRPGNPPVGNYVMTRNASNAGSAPGAYMGVKQHQFPTSLEVHDGHNGGLELLYPSSVVVASV